MAEARSTPADVLLEGLLAEVRDCRACAEHLPCTPRPILQASPQARILIVGQAPGRRAHQSGIPWDDASGDRLRTWLGIDRETFYDPARISILPMGFCYPGKGAGGDRPPRPECAPRWHARVLRLLTRVELTVYAGRFAIRAYLAPGRNGRSLTEIVRAWREFLPRSFPTPHPSPRNRHWLAERPWFESEAVPTLRRTVRGLIDERPRSACSTEI